MSRGAKKLIVMSEEEQRDDGDSASVSAHQNEASPDNNTKTSPTISDGSQPMASPADFESPFPKKNDKDNSTDDTAVTPGSQTEQNKTNLRRGKWTPEEEAYARAVIRDFNSGYLDAPIGTTLRAYLSGKLGCDPMRITKKFTKASSIGKKVFRPAPQHDAKVAKEVEDAQVGLFMLILAFQYHQPVHCQFMCLIYILHTNFIQSQRQKLPIFIRSGNKG